MIVVIWLDGAETRDSHNPSSRFRDHSARFSVVMGLRQDHQSQVVGSAGKRHDARLVFLPVTQDLERCRVSGESSLFFADF